MSMYQAIISSSVRYQMRFYSRINSAYSYVNINIGQLITLVILASGFLPIASIKQENIGLIFLAFLFSIFIISMLLIYSLTYKNLDMEQYIQDLFSLEFYLKVLVFFSSISLAVSVFYLYILLSICCLGLAYSLLSPLFMLAMSIYTLNYTNAALCLCALLTTSVFAQLYKIQRTNEPYYFSLKTMPRYIDITYLMVLIFSISTFDIIYIARGVTLFLIGFAQKSRLIKGALDETTRNFCNPLIIIVIFGLINLIRNIV